MNKNLKPLTWDQLADIYHKHTGQQARTKPMHVIADWAVRQTDKFAVDEEDNICLKED